MTTIHDAMANEWSDEERQLLQDLGGFATIMELIMGPIAECGKHGWVKVLDHGHNSGFAGEGVWWANYSCGCQWVETGGYYDA